MTSSGLPGRPRDCSGPFHGGGASVSLTGADQRSAVGAAGAFVVQRLTHPRARGHRRKAEPWSLFGVAPVWNTAGSYLCRKGLANRRGRLASSQQLSQSVSQSSKECKISSRILNESNLRIVTGIGKQRFDCETAGRYRRRRPEAPFPMGSE